MKALADLATAMAQVVTSPLRDAPTWETTKITVRSVVIYNPVTGANTGLLPLDEFATVSVKRWHALGRPRGMSHAHWRKVRRERRAHR